MPSRQLAVAVVAIIVLQLLVPLVALTLPDKPNRLGWQMYSGLGQDELLVVDQDGHRVDVDWEEVLPVARRPELDWTERLPEYLCWHVDVPGLSVAVGGTERAVKC